MSSIGALYRNLLKHDFIIVDGTTERFRVNTSQEDVASITCHKEANYRVALETDSCSFTVAHLQSGLFQLKDGLFSLGSGSQSVKLSFDSNRRCKKLPSDNETSALGTNLLSAFRYIEQIRSYGVNINGKRKLPKEKNADLHFAGKCIIDSLREHGTTKDNELLTLEIAKFEKAFRS